VVGGAASGPDQKNITIEHRDVGTTGTTGCSTTTQQKTNDVTGSTTTKQQTNC
jgi:hypothetical protein